MKIYAIPTVIKTIIFDIDSTLYTNQEYAVEQVDVQIRHFASLRGMTDDEARTLIGDYRKNWKTEHKGEEISLGNALTAFGIPIEESIRWREKLVLPELYLHRDEKLIATLESLSQKARLIAVTNNPVFTAHKTLQVLGVDQLIPHIIGLDTCGVSKPHTAPYQLAAKLTSSPVEHCISIGDRYDIDLATPLAMGMGAILVHRVEDVYGLPKILTSL